MNKLFIGLFLINFMGSAHAGDSIYITYTNKSSKPLTFNIHSPFPEYCFYQEKIPSSITVQPNHSAGPYYAESVSFYGNELNCFGRPGSFLLDILFDNSKVTCLFVQGDTSNVYEPDPSNCPSNPQITVNNSGNTNSEIIVGPFTQTTHMNQHQMAAPPHVGHEIEHYNTSRVNPMRNMTPPHHASPMPTINHSHMAPPHVEHEIAHYNTSRVNPMMRGHQIMNHKPMIKKR